MVAKRSLMPVMAAVVSRGTVRLQRAFTHLVPDGHQQPAHRQATKHLPSECGKAPEVKFRRPHGTNRSRPNPKELRYLRKAARV